MTDLFTRRTFVTTLATGFAGLGLATRAAAVPPRLLVGHSGSTWGDSPENAEKAIREIAGAGYRGFETTAAVLEGWESKGGLKSVLQQNSLQLRSAYCPFVLTDGTKRAENVANAKKWGKLIKDNGGTIAVIGPDTVARATFKIKNARYGITQELNAIGHALSDAGVTGALHPLFGSCVQTRDEVYSVMEGVDTRVVKIAPDTGELLAGGVDPVKVIHDFGSLVKHAHLKDYNGGPTNDGFCALGDGRVDFLSAIAALEAISPNIMMMVELNPSTNPEAPTPLDAAQKSKEFLRKMGYAFTEKK